MADLRDRLAAHQVALKQNQFESGQIRAELVEKGELTREDLARAVPLELAPGQFYLFHSWILHGSDANMSTLRRAGLNIRFARMGEEYDDAVYFPMTREDT